MILLGLDIGEKRIGVAKSDALGMFAHGMPFIERTVGNEHFAKIQACIDEVGAEKIIVGIPINLDGTEGLAAEQMRAFVDILQDRVSIPVDTWDERLTSKQAMRYMQDSSLSGSKKRQKVDSLAAQIMLQNYLDSNL
jgi:putative Holliday junction resolvase